MVEQTMKAVLKCSTKEVWDIITSLENVQWRSDINRITVNKNKRQFTEYTNENIPTLFTITVFIPFHKYAFQMENTNIKGNWVGTLKEVSDGCEIVFTERVQAKKWYMKPFLKGYLKKQQGRYLKDLKKELKLQ